MFNTIIVKQEKSECCRRHIGVVVDTLGCHVSGPWIMPLIWFFISFQMLRSLDYVTVMPLMWLFKSFQMPGVNLPMNQIVYYLLTLLVCGMLHEIGHAVAAVR